MSRPDENENNAEIPSGDPVEPAADLNDTPAAEESALPDAGDHLPVHERHGPLTDMVDYNFLQYASYVICERAIPHLADGLKPVQRRILHALQEKDDGRFIKVANIVGHAMQYHPHGDASIGDALVTLTNRQYLIEGQGNFGNIFTGDRAAAARYIECRLTDLARQELFNPQLTEMVPSYDGRNQEPVTLPSKLPLLLMLGAEGIAVGLSTSILPHNFIELLQAEIDIIQEKKKNSPDPTLLPDFQTGGIMDVSEYDQGNGRVRVRARIEKRGEDKLLITELPYAQTTESVIASIEEAIKRKKVPVRSINDFTSGQVEIELTLLPETQPDKAIQKLFAFTRCEAIVSCRLIVIHEQRPREMTTGQVLRENVRQVLAILKRELQLKKQHLLDEFHAKTLVQIFIENRLYQRIEECKTYAAVVGAVEGGLEPFLDRLRRPVTRKDIDMLLEVRIKRISRFDMDKNRRELEAILAELERVEKNLLDLKGYAVRYLRGLIQKYGPNYPRRTVVEAFTAPDMRQLTANELTIFIDREKGFLGHGVKGEPLLQCSSLDKLLIIRNDGSFTVMPPPATCFVENKLLWCGLYHRDLVFTAVYVEWGVTYIKRFPIGGVIMNNDYSCIPPKARLLLCEPATPPLLYVKYHTAHSRLITQQTFKPEQVPLKPVKNKGIQMTSKDVTHIAAQPGSWWDPEINSPPGKLTV